MIQDVAPGSRVVLLDIEGTTTPIAFVHKTLFSYARARLDAFLRDHWTDSAVQEATRRLADEHQADAADAPAWNSTSADAQRESVASYARWLMDRDRKSPGLKTIQGLLWETGYQAGELRGEIYDDVPRAMRRWREAGLRIAIYSSGSELAQRRLFESTSDGDLTPLIEAFFDTAVGAKIEAQSYVRIAAALRCSAGEICFVSDVDAELAAAAHAGCATVLSIRPGNPVQPNAERWTTIKSLDEL